MKKYYFLFILLSFGIVYFIIDAPDKNRIPSEMKNSIQSAPSREKFTPPLKITHAPLPEHHSSQHQESIPWDELDQKWLDELNTFLLSIDPQQGEVMFKAFMKGRDSFNEDSLKIINSIKEAEKKGHKNKDLNEELDTLHNKYIAQTKKIFGRHYSEVKKFYLNYEASIQAYSKSEADIGLDPAFAE